LGFGHIRMWEYSLCQPGSVVVLMTNCHKYYIINQIQKTESMLSPLLSTVEASSLTVRTMRWPVGAASGVREVIDACI
jgi:hypothetical protein